MIVETRLKGLDTFTFVAGLFGVVILSFISHIEGNLRPGATRSTEVRLNVPC